MVIDIQKRRERWRRNKKAERARRQVGCAPVDAAIVAKVTAERDWRYRAAADYFLSGAVAEKTVHFTVDVWVAQTILEFQGGSGLATPTRISTWLRSIGKDYGYTEGALRKMIYRARDKIKVLEQAESWINRGQKVWPPFDPNGE